MCPGLETTEVLTCIAVCVKAVKKLPSWFRSEDEITLLNTSPNTVSFPNTPESSCKMNCAFCSLDSKPNTATCRTKQACHTFCSHQVYKEIKQTVVQQLPVLSTKLQRPCLTATASCKPTEKVQLVQLWCYSRWRYLHLGFWALPSGHTWRNCQGSFQASSCCQKWWKHSQDLRQGHRPLVKSIRISLIGSWFISSVQSIVSVWTGSNKPKTVRCLCLNN